MKKGKKNMLQTTLIVILAAAIFVWTVLMVERRIRDVEALIKKQKNVKKMNVENMHVEKVTGLGAFIAGDNPANSVTATQEPVIVPGESASVTTNVRSALEREVDREFKLENEYETEVQVKPSGKIYLWCPDVGFTGKAGLIMKSAEDLDKFIRGLQEVQRAIKDE